jgi:hypothetical protein
MTMAVMAMVQLVLMMMIGDGDDRDPVQGLGSSHGG